MDFIFNHFCFYTRFVATYHVINEQCLICTNEGIIHRHLKNGLSFCDNEIDPRSCLGGYCPIMCGFYKVLCQHWQLNISRSCFPSNLVEATFRQVGWLCVKHYLGANQTGWILLNKREKQIIKEILQTTILYDLLSLVFQLSLINGVFIGPSVHSYLIKKRIILSLSGNCVMMAQWRLHLWDSWNTKQSKLYKNYSSLENFFKHLDILTLVTISQVSLMSYISWFVGDGWIRLSLIKFFLPSFFFPTTKQKKHVIWKNLIGRRFNKKYGIFAIFRPLVCCNYVLENKS